jgi:hypothetical protein
MLANKVKPTREYRRVESITGPLNLRLLIRWMSSLLTLPLSLLLLPLLLLSLALNFRPTVGIRRYESLALLLIAIQAHCQTKIRVYVTTISISLVRRRSQRRGCSDEHPV